jgi:transposase
MSWHLVSAMDARVQFVADYQRQTFSMTELCRRYGISRQAGYETLERYHTRGAAGLAPNRVGRSTVPPPRMSRS